MSISPLAVVSKGAEIGTGVTVHPFAIIHEGVVLGSGVSIGAYCEIGVPTPLAQTKRLVIAPNSTIRSHSVFYSGSEFGQELITGHQWA